MTRSLSLLRELRMRRQPVSRVAHVPCTRCGAWICRGQAYWPETDARPYHPGCWRLADLERSRPLPPRAIHVPSEAA